MKRSLSAFLFVSSVALPLSVSAAPRRGRPVTRSEIIASTSAVSLAFPGVRGPIDYEKYGTFEGLGTSHYKYVISDQNGAAKSLAKAAGEGIFPNKDVTRDPRFQQLLKSGALAGNEWKFVDSRNLEANFYKWASTAEEPGVKQFYTALVFERLGMIEEAIKAYYAIVVHFPKSVSYTYYNTPWYLGPSCIDRIEQMVRRHPELGMAYIPGKISIANKFDNDPKNDVFSIDPGRLVPAKSVKREKPVNLAKLKVIKTVGGSHVQLKEFENHHWQLLVDGKPFPVRAITYSVTPVGASPDRRTWNVSRDWQLLDSNHNGVHDGFFESYVDKNHNDKRDPDEPVVGDAKLLHDMGVNTLRAYHHLYNKELFRRLYKEQGFHILCGDLLGAYAVGSGATWDVGTDYTDPSQQKQMLDGVRAMVEEYKDEPYILMWVLGNENIYPEHANNAGKNPAAFYEFVDRAAQLIHEIDPNHPVAISNGDLMYLNLIGEKCPHLDVLGANVYRGEHGFGRHLFSDVQDVVDKPMLVTEYGASAYAEGYTQDEADAYQAMYIGNNWDDLEANMAGHGVGNALGGVLFEWMDEWWKANADLPEEVQRQRADWYASKSDIYKSLQPDHHDIVPQFGFPFLDGWSYEEWYGVVSQGSGQDSPFERQLRPSYFTLRDMWNKK